jgi:hypothetical protein
VALDDRSGELWRDAAARRGASDKRRREAASRYVRELQDHDDIALFELENDPDVVAVEDAQRSYAGQYRRRLRRLRSRW